MKELLPLRGIVTVLNTPLTHDDTIDVGGLKKHVAYALDAGVSGFLVPALASEVDKLSFAERMTVLETVLEANGGRVPLIAGASAPGPAERMKAARAAIAAGCDGVLVNVPFTGEDEFEDAIRHIADLAPPLLMIQDWSPGGYGLPIPLIQHLFETIEPFRALKIEVVPAGVKYSEVLQATEGRLHVSGGWAVTQMIEGLDRGVHAFMPTGLHRTYTRIVARYATGDRDGAVRLFERLLPILAFSNQHLDLSIHFFKRLLHAQGVYATPRVREPILPFDDVHERIAGELIRRAVALEQTD